LDDAPKSSKKTSFRRSKENQDTERLQVVLARFGIASRRGVVEIIESGKVTVNGKVVTEKGLRIDPAKDRVAIEGRELEGTTTGRKSYFMLNKPKGVMTTLQDPHAERTVADFFRDVPARLFPVGRLDRDTTGLVLMTDDGELAFRLTHPRFGVAKRYRAGVEGAVTDQTIRRLEGGVMLEEGRTAPCRIDVSTRSPEGSVLYVTLHEGKKRQIRRIFQKMGHFVRDLERIEYGPLKLDDLRPGHRRELRAAEVRLLQEVTGLSRPRPGRSPRPAPEGKKGGHARG